MKKAFLLIVLFFSVALGACARSLPAYADVNDFTVNDFSADYYLTNADPQGQMHVIEKISVTYTDQNHGLLRALPMTYKNQPLRVHINKVSSDSGAPAQYSTYDSNGNLVLKIGDPSRTVTGHQEYTIDYIEQNVITFYPDHDELYWNVNGDQWSQPFDMVSVTLHAPSTVHYSSQAPKCFAGTSGTSQNNCTIERTSDICDPSHPPVNVNSYRYYCEPPTNDLIMHTFKLDPGSSLTFVVGFNKGYFHTPSWLDYVYDYAGDTAALLGPIVLLGGGAFVWWLKRGRDAKGSGTIVPEYDAPDGLRPIEAGAIMNFHASARDITATLIDLAIKGYIRIVEKDSKILLVKSQKFAIQIVRHDWQDLNDWEQLLLAGLAVKADVEGVADLSKPIADLRESVKSIMKAVDKSLTMRGYFRSNPYVYFSWPVAGAIVVFWLFAPASGDGLLSVSSLLKTGLVVGAIMAAAFIHFMPARTTKGVIAKEHLQGLKLYLEVAEKDRIAMLQSPDAPYAEKSAEPEHTVELFEKLLPYAIVLKVEKEWAKKFEHIYSSPPSWYTGNYTVFNVGYLVGSLGDSFGTAVNQSFAAPRSSSGSGFGGGFAGGGGGGGGGGGW